MAEAPLPRPRRPWIAGLMAALCSGFGHLYVGNWRAAIAIPVVVTGGMSVALVGVLLAGGSSLAALAIALAIAAVLWGVQILAAVRVAASRPPDYVPTGVNHWWVYVLWFVLMQGATAGPAMALRANVLEVFKIPSDSMQPALLPGDFVAIPKIGPHALGEPALGQLVVFEYPPDRSVSYIKRIVGTAGQTATVERSRLFIDGVISSTACNQPTAQVNDRHGRTSEANCWVESVAGGGSWPVLVSRSRARGPGANWGPEQVPPGELLMFGDFRTSSSDSRVWGTVPVDHLIGAPDRVVFSWEGAPRWGRIGTPLQP